MSELRAALGAVREQFIEDMCAGGFRPHSETLLVGDLDIDDQPVTFDITVPVDFPVVMPKVRTPGGEGGLSWHRERDGHFCLWSADEAGELPWLTAAAVLQRIRDWHAKDAAGWPEDPPDLDLERYWPRVAHLIVHPALEPLVGRPCRIERARNNIYRLSAGLAPKNSKLLNAEVIDVGELSAPVRNFDELAGPLPAGAAVGLRRRIESGRTQIVMVRYRRQGHNGVIGLVARDRNPHTLSAAETAEESAEVIRLRAGFDAETLANKAVAVIGLGAVGSLVADLLARSGAGRLTLQDHGVIRPGNCVRHLATLKEVGRAKVDAVRDRLVADGFIALSSVVTDITALTSVDSVEAIFDVHDLVIDATGSGSVTALVLKAAEVLRRPALSVCLQRSGTVVRVDRLPLRAGEVHAAPTPAGMPFAELREGGCGETVAPTPPWACSTAASLCAAIAADLLAGRHQYPASVVEVLVGDSGVGLKIGRGS